jgi:hypothetical protein
MKVIGPALQNYGFINALRTDEQARIRHQQNLKNLEKMNRQTIQSAEQKSETQRIENAKWDRVRQAKEAYLGTKATNLGHNETMRHVDIKV